MKFLIWNETDMRGMERGSMDHRIGTFESRPQEFFVGEISNEMRGREGRAIDSDNIMFARESAENCAANPP